jgi:N-acyl-phosphatidylethanolamine-hydrolysing phospholipase D
MNLIGGKPREYTGKPPLFRTCIKRRAAWAVPTRENRGSVPMPAMMIRTLASLLLSTALAACAQAPAAPGTAPHHRDGHFQNNHLDFEPKGLWALTQWRLKALREGLPKPPQTPTPVVAPDLAFLRANAQAGAAALPTATWIGHATVLVQLPTAQGVVHLLTDPIFSERASPLSFIGPKRAQPPGIALNELPHIDLVVVSHNHYDHMDAASLLALNAQAGGPPLFVVPLGNRRWLADAGITNAVELDWWQSHTVGEVRVMLTPVQHWSGRTLSDRLETLWGGYAITSSRFHVFHAGDTGYSADFQATRERLAPLQKDGGFDLALIPIGAYEPRWFMATQHVNPAEALQIHRDLGAKQSLGMHWGTFELTDESLDEPPRELARVRQAAGLSENDFFLLAVGQTRRFTPRR